MRRYVEAIILLGTVLVLTQSCSEQNKKQDNVIKNVQYVSGQDEITYRRIGKEVVDSVQSKLKSNLLEAMQKEGPTNAVKFCNAEALSITVSYSSKYGTEVKRVSDKNRNPNNAPNEKELAVINHFKETMESGDPVLPKVAIDAEGRKHFYAPIFTGGMCLTCHGNLKNMQPELVTVLDSLYPTDRAKGYSVDELRGIWSIKFKNS